MRLGDNKDLPNMFEPSQADVRRFFCGTFQKWQQQAPMEAMETLAAYWMALHPEYHPVLGDLEQALADMGNPKAGQENPFLHLSMHLSISEQCSIDQPRGIRQAVELLTARLGDLHEAHHQVMECLGTMLFESQRSGQPPDPDAYINAVQQRATGV
jgi:hypothetical protein